MAGYIKIKTAAGADVRIYDSESGRYAVDGKGGGYVALPAPPVSATLDPRQVTAGYALYDVLVRADGYDCVFVHGAEIVAGTKSTLEVPLVRGGGRVRHVYINAGALPTRAAGAAAKDTVSADIAKRGGGVHLPAYPENITVHLGAPNTRARNVTVPFADYAASIASSEIYPTWPREALTANVMAIANFALNRLYVGWYRGKGYDFDITNNAAYDQYYVHGRNVYDNVAEIAKSIRGRYIRRKGDLHPLFTEYASGTAVERAGALRQWESAELAKAGMDARGILKYFYGSDIEIAEF